MSDFLDLHCHYVPGIDDGVRSVGEAYNLLVALRGLGFAEVVATPHMRPGLFDNDQARIRAGFAAVVEELEGREGLPRLSLSSEHYFDDIVFQRLCAGDGLPYPGGKAVLIELHAEIFPVRLADRFFDLRRRRLRPVLAHPERYAPVWRDIHLLDPIVDGGAVLLLDICALVGKYGKQPERAAHKLLEDGYYYAACTDAHREGDPRIVEKAIVRLVDLAGDEEARFLLGEGPRNIVEGRVES